MNRWVQRGLRTALLTGGLLAAGAGVAAADENDVTADVLGVTATVPVEDGAVVRTPVVTGTGEDLTVGSAAGDGLVLPVDTNTGPGTTVLGDDGTGGLSVPVRVTEADDTPPDPADGLTVTVPVNTSGGGTTGTTVTVPVATGDLGDVLDGDPTTGTAVDVDLTDPVEPGPAGSGLLLDLEDTVTVGDDDPVTGRDRVLEAPVSLDGDRPTSVDLPLPGTEEDGGPLSGDSVEVDLLGGSRPDEDPDGEPDLSLPVGAGGLLPGLLGGDAASDGTVDVDLGGGTVVAVPVDEGGTGTDSDLLVRITLPLDLAGLLGGAGSGTGTPPGDGTTDPSGNGSGDGSDGGSGDGSGSEDGDGDGTGEGPGGGQVPGSGTPGSGPGTGSDGTGTDGSSTDGSATGWTRSGGTSGGTGAECAGPAPDTDAAGADTGGSTAPGGPSGSGPGSEAGGVGPATGDACGTGSSQAVATRAATTAPLDGPVTPSAGLLAMAGLLLTAGRGRLWRDRARP
ncbi:hypothetical protein ACI782_09775 [Geodermatophilus sp. SYSU D00703]